MNTKYRFGYRQKHPARKVVGVILCTVVVVSALGGVVIWDLAKNDSKVQAASQTINP